MVKFGPPYPGEYSGVVIDCNRDKDEIRLNTFPIGLPQPSGPSDEHPSLEVLLLHHLSVCFISYVLMSVMY